MQQNDIFKNSDSNGSQNGNNREMAMVPLGIEDKAKGILEAHSMVKVEDEVNLIKVQILDTQE